MMTDKLSACLDRFFKIEPKVCKFVSKIVRNDEDAKDILQDLQVRIIERYSMIDLSGIDSWIFRVAYYLTCNFLKRNKRRRCISIDIAEGCINDTSFEAKVEYAELCNLLHAHLNCLSKDDSDLIKRHYLEELSFPEIAEKAGKSINTVRSKTYRAKRKLQKQFKEESINRDDW